MCSMFLPFIIVSTSVLVVSTFVGTRTCSLFSSLATDILRRRCFTLGEASFPLLEIGEASDTRLYANGSTTIVSLIAPISMAAVTFSSLATFSDEVYGAGQIFLICPRDSHLWHSGKLLLTTTFRRLSSDKVSLFGRPLVSR